MNYRKNNSKKFCLRKYKGETWLRRRKNDTNHRIPPHKPPKSGNSGNIKSEE